MTTRNLSIGGEIIAVSDAIKLVDRLYARAYEIAGAFYENNRSKKFRVNWPDAYEFAEANKRAFVEQARADFSKVLADPKTTPREKHQVYLALLLERAFSEGLKGMGNEADTRLQVRAGTQQFDGDKAENLKIAENFGEKPNLRAVLLKGAAKLATMH
jgi:hypothetical protein